MPKARSAPEQFLATLGQLPTRQESRIPSPYGGGSKPMGSHFGVGEFTTHFRTYFSGDWDVHWGYGLLTHHHIALFWLVCVSSV